MTIDTAFATRNHDDTADLPRLCRELDAFLAGMKGSIDEEIRTYPTPIPRCDAQFNHLYDERARLGQLLARLHEFADGGNSLDHLALLAAFVAMAPCTTGGEERDLRARIGAALAAPHPASTADPNGPAFDHGTDRR